MTEGGAVLIRNASLLGGQIADVRVVGGKVAEIGTLPASAGETVVDAGGGLLLPGLHDHHIHVPALAAALESVSCGPPSVTGLAGLTRALQQPGTGWLRGIGYHESVAGVLDTAMLDDITPDRPVRVQHRSGRMWFFNSAALAILLADTVMPVGLDRATGRLFDDDGWLRARLASRPPGFAAVGAMLAAVGVTGVTEMSPGTDAAMAQHFAAERRAGHLPQTVVLAGKPELCAADMADGICLGPVKLHLHEAALPALDATAAMIRRAHHQGRPVAVHCATEVELVFTIAALDDAGVLAGDRIEHAGVTPDTALADIARLGLAVVSQPHFIAERGDAYRAQVEARDRPLLYRLRAFIDAGVTLAGGSDAPFGGANPWQAMAAAVSRQTRSGAIIGGDEALTPEQALDLYLAVPETLHTRRRLTIGSPADLCLIDRSWAKARTDLASVQVKAVWLAGRQIV